MMGRVRLEDVRTVALTLRTLLTARVVLARRGFPGAIAHFGLTRGVVPSVDDADHLSTPAVRRQVRVAFRVLRWPVVRGTCLPTSITLARVLARAGLTPEVVLGVATAGGFAAHAWVEVDGHRLDASRLPPEVYHSTGRFLVPS
jgi:Transglutaminase-like superfamily